MSDKDKAFDLMATLTVTAGARFEKSDLAVQAIVDALNETSAELELLRQLEACDRDKSCAAPYLARNMILRKLDELRSDQA